MQIKHQTNNTHPYTINYKLLYQSDGTLITETQYIQKKVRRVYPVLLIGRL